MHQSAVQDDLYLHQGAESGLGVVGFVSPNKTTHRSHDLGDSQFGRVAVSECALPCSGQQCLGHTRMDSEETPHGSGTETRLIAGNCEDPGESDVQFRN